MGNSKQDNICVYPAQPKPTEGKRDCFTDFLLEVIEKISDENAELKRLLSLAATDLKYALDTCEQDMLCDICDYNSLCNCKNYCYASKKSRKWQHHDEAMKLIGDDENAD